MAKNKPMDIVIAQDTREKKPYDFSFYDLKVELVGLPYGDYTLLYPDLRNILVIERKSIDDLANCCGNDRERFERELLALRGYRHAYVIGEFSLSQVIGCCYKSQIHPHSIIGSIAKWQSWGIRFVFLENRTIATYYVASLFRNLANQITNQAKNCCEQFQSPFPIPYTLEFGVF